MEGPVKILLEAGNYDFKQESQVRIPNEILACPNLENFVKITDNGICKVPAIMSVTHTKLQLSLSFDIVHSLVCPINLRFSHPVINLNEDIPFFF